MRPPQFSRRDVLKAGVAPVSLVLSEFALPACNAEAVGADSDTGVGEVAVRDAGRLPWARGGTKVLAAEYPDPFSQGDDPNPCLLTSAMTLGPCFTTSPVRRDISEGQLGLPMRVYLRVLDETCRPIPDAVVDLWHTSARGVYSGAEVPSACTLGDPEAAASLSFRGAQPADGQGLVIFDSCFPGWYSGRTLHVHLSVRRGAQQLLTTQLYFDDVLGDEIVDSEPVYRDRGPRNTTNQTDSVVSAAAVSDFLFQTARAADGALLVWKTLVLGGDIGAAAAG